MNKDKDTLLIFIHKPDSRGEVGCVLQEMSTCRTDYASLLDGGAAVQFVCRQIELTRPGGLMKGLGEYRDTKFKGLSKRI